VSTTQPVQAQPAICDEHALHASRESRPVLRTRPDAPSRRGLYAGATTPRFVPGLRPLAGALAAYVGGSLRSRSPPGPLSRRGSGSPGGGEGYHPVPSPPPHSACTADACGGLPQPPLRRDGRHESPATRGLKATQLRPDSGVGLMRRRSGTPCLPGLRSAPPATAWSYRGGLRGGWGSQSLTPAAPLAAVRDSIDPWRDRRPRGATPPSKPPVQGLLRQFGPRL